MTKQRTEVAVSQFNEDLPSLLLRMCKAYGVSQKDIKGHSKKKTLVTARKAFAYSAWIRGAFIEEL